MDMMFAGLDFALTYLNDVLIESKTRNAEHIKKVFERIRECGFKLSDGKVNSLCDE